MSNGEGVSLGYAEVLRSTPYSVHFDTKEHGRIWVPRSLIHDDSETWGQLAPKGKLVVYLWFAEKHGWA